MNSDCHWLIGSHDVSPCLLCLLQWTPFLCPLAFAVDCPFLDFLGVSNERLAFSIASMSGEGRVVGGGGGFVQDAAWNKRGGAAADAVTSLPAPERQV